MVVIIDGQKALKVDAHSHILPRTWPAKPGVRLRCVHVEDGPFSARLEWEDGSLFRKLKPNCFDADVILEECDQTGVDVQVLGRRRRSALLKRLIVVPRFC